MPADSNPKRHAKETLDDSLIRWGYTEPILMDERTGKLVAGHGRLDALKVQRDRNGSVPDGIKVEGGNWLVPVTRGWSSQNDDEANAYLVASNRLTEIGGWDNEELVSLLSSLDDLEGVGYTLEELNALSSQVTELPTAGGNTDPDSVPDPPKKSRSSRGDVWTLGAHRVMCGDSTDVDDVLTLMGEMQGAQLLHADPPYGMGKEADGIANDNLYREKLDSFQMDWWRAWRPYMTENSSAYIWGNAEDLWRLWWANGLADSEPLTIRNELVWAKASAGAGGISHMGAEGLRLYPQETERCLFFMIGEQGFNNNADNYWTGWEPIRSYLDTERKRTGWTNKDVAAFFGFHPRMADHWFNASQWLMPKQEQYECLQMEAKGVAFTRSYAELKAEYDKLKVEHDKLKAEFYESRAYFDNTHDNMTDVWQFPRVTGGDRHGHATPKPVAMIERALKSSCPVGGVVLEPFGGSGSTLIAAQNVGVSCYTMELKPEWADVICKRFQEYTGKKPVLESTGEEVDFVAA